MALLPFLLLGIFNGLIFHMIHKSSSRQVNTSRRRERDYTIAMMLSSVVLVFFACGSVRIVLNFWEVIHLNCSAWAKTSVFRPGLGPKQNTIFTVIFSTTTHPPTATFFKGSRHIRRLRFGM